MAAEAFFNRIAKDVLEATEHISNQLEEGVSALLTGELPKAATQQQQQHAESQQEFDPADYEHFEGMDEEEIRRMIQEEMMTGSPLNGIADGVMEDIMQGQVGPQSPMEHLQAFRSAITWSEPFIYSLVAFQVVMFLLCLVVSRKSTGIAPRLTLMVFIGILVRCAEWLNGIGARNWEKYCTQNYFDSKGIFIGIMLCGPLLVDCLIMLMLFVREAGQLLVQVKTTELKKKRGKESQQGDSSSAANGAAAGSRKKKDKADKKKD